MRLRKSIILPVLFSIAVMLASCKNPEPPPGFPTQIVTNPFENERNPSPLMPQSSPYNSPELPPPSEAPGIASSPGSTVIITSHTLISDESLWYRYYLLSPPERGIYSELCSSADEWLNVITADGKYYHEISSAGATESAARNALNAALRDNPLLRFIFAKVEVVTSPALAFSDSPDSYIESPAQAGFLVSKIESAAEEFTAPILSLDLDAYETYRALLTELVLTLTYDQPDDDDFLNFDQQPDVTEGVWYASSPYGGLINHSTICYGYAETYQYLCHYLGLWCIPVDGTSNGTDKHRWNIVMLDDSYYHVDVTWSRDYSLAYAGRYDDATLDRMDRRYFMLTEKQTRIDHYISDTDLPVCDDTAYAFDSGSTVIKW